MCLTYTTCSISDCGVCAEEPEQPGHRVPPEAAHRCICVRAAQAHRLALRPRRTHASMFYLRLGILDSQQITYCSVLILCVVSAAASGRDPPAAGRVLAVGGQVLAARSRRQAAHWARRADHSDRIRARRRTHASSPLSQWYTTLVDYSFCRLRNLLKC